MGDVQSTQRGSGQDAAAEEERREGDNPQTAQDTEYETFKNSEQTSDISRKGDEVKMKGCCEDENGAQCLTLIPTKGAAPETQVNGEESPGEVDANDVHLEITEMDVKQNDINAFGRFFSNIGLKLTINRGSVQKARDDNTTTTEKSEETETEKTEEETEGSTEPESPDRTRPLLTALTSEDTDKTAKTTEEPQLRADGATDPQEQELILTSPVDVEIDSPVRRFFANGLFAGLWKKKEPGEETAEKELEGIGGNQVTEATGQTVQEGHDEEVTTPCVVGEAGQKENELRDETSGKPPEPDILKFQERVQMSPLLRFMSGSNLKRLSMKQRNIKSSEARLCDSGEHPAETPPSESAEDHKNDSALTSAEAAQEEGAWASFKRFMSPKPRMKKSYHSPEETQQPMSVEEPKTEQTSDHSSEEGKKRKNSSVSWEAVLCGSGRRSRRKTSDSEDEMSPIDSKYHKEVERPKSGEESGAEHEKETSSSLKQDGTPQEEDGNSTWKSLKRIVTPKRKSRDEDERIKIQSDGEGAQENSSFSIKNLLPGRKKQRSDESQGRASADEAEKDEASDEEDSETPGVVPLSEFEVAVEEKERKDENLEIRQDQAANMNLCFPQDFNGLETSKKDEDTNEGPNDVTELANKHQQLSDIPEEGMITEPGATLALVNEEAEGRDDTMAEDLTGITSEVITAPEPAADITLQDETEMFTAVSQFSSESGKTSGNATPVPAESDTIQTDVVLHQVTETFATSPKTSTLQPEHTFEEFVKKDPTILEEQKRPKATSTETGLNVEDLKAISGLVSASLREGISKVAEFKSVGSVSEVAIEEFDGAEMTLDEVEMMHLTQKFPVEQVEIKSVINTCQESDLASAMGVTIEDRELEQEVQTLTENELTKPNIPDHSEAEDEEQPSAEEDVQELASEGGVETGENKVREASAERLLATEANVGAVNVEHIQEPEKIKGPLEGRVPSHEPKVIFDNISMRLGTGTCRDKPKVETRLLIEVTLEQLDASKSVEEPEDLQTEQASSLKVQNGSMSSHEPQMGSENLATAETGQDEADETPFITEAFEPAEAPQEKEVLEAVQEPSSNVGEVSTVSQEIEVISENISKAGTVEDEPREETTEHNVPKTAEEPDVSQPYEAFSEMSKEISVSDNITKPQEISNTTVLTEDSLELVEASQTVEELEVLQAASPSVETEEKTDNIPKEEIVVDESKKDTIITEDTLKSEEAFATTEEPEVTKAVQASALGLEEIILKVDLDTIPFTEDTCKQTDDAQNVEEELSPTGQPSSKAEETEQNNVSSLQAEETSENFPKAETAPDETKEEIIFDSEDTETLEDLESVRAVHPTQVESEHPSLVKEVACDHVSEPVLGEHKDETIPSDTNLQSLDPAETVGEAGVIKVLHQSLESEENKEATRDNISEEETAPGEPRDEPTVAGVEIITEPVDDSKAAEDGELQTVETSSFVSEESFIPPLTAEETCENIHGTEPNAGEHKVETVREDEPELSQTVEVSSLESEDNNIHSAEPQITSEIILKEDTVPDEPRDLQVHSEVDLVSKAPPETVGEAEVLKVLQQALESEETKEGKCDNTLKEDTVPDESRDETTVAVGEAITEPVDESKTAQILEEFQILETSSLVREESSISPYEPDETSENNLTAEADKDENKEEPMIHAKKSIRSEDAARLLQEPEEIQTMLEAESQTLVKDQTAPDEDVTGAATEIFFEKLDHLKTVQTSSLVSEEISILSLGPEETSEKTLKADLDTDEHKLQTTVVTEDTSVPLGDAQNVEESELSPTVQPSTEEIDISSLEAEQISENLPKAEAAPEETHQEMTLDPENTETVEELETVKALAPTLAESDHPSLANEAGCDHVSEESVPDEPKAETILSDTNLQSLDPAETVGEAEVLKVLQQALESEETKEATCNNISEEETAPGEPRDETIVAGGETIIGPMDATKTAEVGEDLQTVETSSFVSEETSISTLKAEETSEKVLKADLDSDEHKLKTIVTEDTPEPQDEAQNVEESELSPTVELSPEEINDSLLDMSKEEISENLPKAATAPSETQQEMILEPEDTETVEERETVRALPPTPAESEHPSLVKEATCDHVSEETVAGEEETITETVEASKPAQEPEVPEELQIKPNNVAEAETDTILLSEVHLKPVEVHEPEILKTVQAASFKSVEASYETQVTSENIPKIETNPDEEDVTLDTTDDLNLVEPEHDRPVEEAKTEHVCAANTSLDNSKSEDQAVETSEQPETVPQEDSISEEKFHTLTAGQVSEESVVPDETRHEVHLSEEQVATEQVKEDTYSGTEPESVEGEDPAAPQINKGHPKVASEALPDILMDQTSEALMVTMQVNQVVKEEVKAAPPPMRDGVAEEVEEGKVEDNDTAERDVIDVATTSGRTTVDSVLEVEEMQVKHGMDVCCTVVHTAQSLSVTTELEKELILEEDGATTQEEKPQVQSKDVTEGQEYVNVDSRERGAVERQSNKMELETEVEGLTSGFEDEKPASSEQQESQDVLETPEAPGCSESSVHEDASEGYDKNKDEVMEKESATVQVTEAFQSPPGTKQEEADQDEWMDAEENINVQEETAGSFYEAEEPLESERDEDVEQTGMEREVGTAHASRTEGEGSEERNKVDEGCGFKTEDQDFDVALVHPENTNVTTVSLMG